MFKNNEKKKVNINTYHLVAVTSSEIAIGKQKLGVTLKYYKQDTIHFTKCARPH